MEIIAIEKRTFEQMVQHLENFVRQVKTLCGNSHDSSKWMDNTEVCEVLQISPRTLQSYRNEGTLPYSQIGRKCYYKTTDIELLVSQSQINK